MGPERNRNNTAVRLWTACSLDRNWPLETRKLQRLPNLHTVCDWYVCPGLTIVDGNAGWFGESG